MAIGVNMGAMLQCSFGVAPSTLVVIPQGPPVLMESKPAATIMDFKPMANIMPFGMCTAPTNPAVIAALGSPVPCMPVTVAPWIPGGATTVMINNFPALTNMGTLMCMWAGVIKVANPGATKEMLP
jgi:hypothetical protein